MGANYEGQEADIEELSRLSPGAKKFLCHHINNALMGVIGGAETDNIEMVKKSAWHIHEDLKLAGIIELPKRSIYTGGIDVQERETE